MRRPSRLGPLLAVLVFALGAQSSGPIEWNRLADVGTVQIVTKDEDGTPRETKIWLVVFQGHGYVRSSGTRWLANVERNPDVTVRIGEQEHPLRASPVRDSETYQAVQQAFREKYGFSDVLTGVFRSLGGAATILRLDPRTSLSPVN
jgi:hypothetical protein